MSISTNKMNYDNVKKYYEASDATEGSNPVFNYDTYSSVGKALRMACSPLTAIYNVFHSSMGYVGIPATMKTWENENPGSTDEWSHKCFTLDVDGYKIDATILGNRGASSSKRWVLGSFGNGGCYQEEMYDSKYFKPLLTELKANAIVFNYTGVDKSSGPPNRKAMAKAYEIMLKILEDKTDGLGAEEIVGYGHSIGGGVQSDGIKNHKFKPTIKYVFIKDRTFSNASKVFGNCSFTVLDFKSLKCAYGILEIDKKFCISSYVAFGVFCPFYAIGKIVQAAVKPFFLAAALCVKISGWDFDCTSVSEKLKQPEIILQTGSVKTSGTGGEGSKRESGVVNTDEEEGVRNIFENTDGLILKTASLAYALLAKKDKWVGKKTFIAIEEDHAGSLTGAFHRGDLDRMVQSKTMELLTTVVNDYLPKNE